MSIHSAAVAAADAEAVLWSGMRTRILLNTAGRRRANAHARRAGRRAARRRSPARHSRCCPARRAPTTAPGVIWRAVSSTATTPRTHARCTTSRMRSPPTNHTTSCTAITPRSSTGAGRSWPRSVRTACRRRRSWYRAASPAPTPPWQCRRTLPTRWRCAPRAWARPSPAAPCTRRSPGTARTRIWSAHCSSRRAIRAYCWSMP